MIRRKVKKQSSILDKNGKFIPSEYEAEEIIVESVGDMIDLLAPYSRGASMFMVPPEKGKQIQRVQVWDIRPSREDNPNMPAHAHHLHRAMSFTIGEEGDHWSYDLFEKQLARERAEGGRKQGGLTWQDMQAIDRLCTRICEQNLLSGKSDKEVYEQVLNEFNSTRR